MLKKEILDSLKRLAESLLIFLTIPFILFVDRIIIKFGVEFSDLYFVVFYFFVTFFSVNLGATIFQSEKKDKAFEYLFSLPLSRTNILLYKILPRLILLCIVTFIFSMSKGFGTSFPAMLQPVVYLKTMYFITYFIFLFFLSVFLSFAFNSVALCFIGVYILSFLRLYTSQSFDYLAWKLFPNLLGKRMVMYFNEILSACVLLIPIGIAFWITYKKMDNKPLKFQTKKYYVTTISTIAILIFYVVFFFKKTQVWFIG